MNVGSIIKNNFITNRYSGKKLIGIIIKVSDTKCKYWVVDIESGNKYIWLSRECELVYK